MQRSSFYRFGSLHFRTIGFILGIVVILGSADYFIFHFTQAHLRQQKFDYYQTLVPSGWHAIVPLASDNSYDYAISPDIPGLILTCGFKACYRSQDNGQSWYMIKSPSVGKLVAPMGGNGTFFLAEFTLKPSDRLWVSHDMGSTWVQLHPQGYLGIGVENVLQMVGKSFYRNGKLFGQGGNVDVESPQANHFAISDDDGQTWIYPEKELSNAELQGWHPATSANQLVTIAPDYRTPHAWFRILTLFRQYPLLELSNDDGQRWSSIGFIRPISTENNLEGYFSMVTSPFQPSSLCIALGRPLSLDSEDSPLIFRSKDAGDTWEMAVAPANPPDMTGGYLNNIQIGQTGNCYAAHTSMSKTGTSSTNIVISEKIWEFSGSDFPLETLLDTTKLGIDPVIFTPSFVFIPSGSAIASHLMLIGTNRESFGPNWSVIYATDNSNFLVWRDAA